MIRNNKLLNKIFQKLAVPGSAYPLGLFRILLGLLMVWELWHYYFGRNEIEDFFLLPTFHFKYMGFGWVPNLAPFQMKIFLVFLAILFLLFSIGLFYRVVSVLCFIGFSWFFLMERAIYLNHWYLACLILFLMLLMPANRVWSVDAKFGSSEGADKIPGWCMNSLLILTGIVYFFSGVAKLNPDWLNGQPLILIFQDKIEEVPGFMKLIFENASLVYFLAMFTVVLELLAFPLLLKKSTRGITFSILVLFNLLNLYLFPIGMFPILMILLTSLFLPASFLLSKLSGNQHSPKKDPSPSIAPLNNKLILVLSLFFIIQIIMPCRKTIYRGSQLWSEEGNLFSWPMFTAYRGGDVYFITHHTNHPRKDTIYPKQQNLTEGQYTRMVKNPDMILQYAHHLQELYNKQSITDVQIYADAFGFMNGRPLQRFIHPNIDLTKEKRRWLSPYPWVMPLAFPIQEKLPENKLNSQ